MGGEGGKREMSSPNKNYIFIFVINPLDGTLDNVDNDDLHKLVKMRRAIMPFYKLGMGTMEREN
jgi:hypothetical protein